MSGTASVGFEDQNHQPWLFGLRVTIGAHTGQWRLHHIDSHTFSVIGCPVPEDHVVHVGVVLSPILRVTLRARAHAPDHGENRQFFSFVNAEPEVLDLVLSAAPAVQVH
jgi:hypothetical protein